MKEYMPVPFTGIWLGGLVVKMVTCAGRQARVLLWANGVVH